MAKAPWWGGVFESMIRMMKRCQKKIVGRARLSLDELTTLITEIDGVINSRPISYVSSDHTEEPLTPAHLLCGRRLLSLPDLICYTDEEEEYGVSREHVTRRLEHLNKFLSDFWNRWQSEYLLNFEIVTDMVVKRQTAILYILEILCWCTTLPRQVSGS